MTQHLDRQTASADELSTLGMFTTVRSQSILVEVLTRLGNGIQQAFYQDPDVLYISLHVHEGGDFYPQGPYGDHLHCGGEAGEGK